MEMGKSLTVQVLVLWGFITFLCLSFLLPIFCLTSLCPSLHKKLFDKKKEKKKKRRAQVRGVSLQAGQHRAGDGSGWLHSAHLEVKKALLVVLCIPVLKIRIHRIRIIFPDP